MKLIVGILVISLVLGLVFVVVAQVGGGTYEIRIWLAGTHYDYEKGVTTPLYSLSVGDPMPYEEELARNSPAASGFSSQAAFRGTVYVRYPGNGELWFARTCRRPKTPKEIEQWQYERVNGLPSSFCKDSKPDLPQRVLPKPFDVLSASDLAMVDYVIDYDVNAIRLYFKALTTLRQAKALVEAVGKKYVVRLTDNTDKSDMRQSAP